MFYLEPDRSKAHVILFYKNFQSASSGKVSHIGLGVNALITAKILRKNNIRTDLFGVWEIQHIIKHLTDNPTATHCIIEAPWVSIKNTEDLLFKFPNVHFIVRVHSNIAFLQVENSAIKLIRDLIILNEQSLNVTLAANSFEFASFVEKAYHGDCLYLPNLYETERVYHKRHKENHKTLKISSFGALRLLKNHTTAIAAALLIAQQEQADLEFWVNNGREEHGKGVIDAMRTIISNVPGAKLIENPWQSWAEFRRTVRSMDLCLQTSFTETFNITLADAVAEMVPVVGSPAISWLPKQNQANPDSVDEVARVGSYVLNDSFSAERAFEALKEYSENGLEIWLQYLGGQPSKKQRHSKKF